MLTFLTVRLSILHVEEAVSKRFLAGCTDEAGGMPRLSQSVHHFLEGEKKKSKFRTENIPGERELGLASESGLAAVQVA